MNIGLSAAEDLLILSYIAAVDQKDISPKIPSFNSSPVAASVPACSSWSAKTADLSILSQLPQQLEELNIELAREAFNSFPVAAGEKSATG